MNPFVVLGGTRSQLLIHQVGQALSTSHEVQEISRKLQGDNESVIIKYSYIVWVFIGKRISCTPVPKTLECGRFSRTAKSACRPPLISLTMAGNQESRKDANTVADAPNDDPEYMTRQFNRIQTAITQQRWYLVLNLIHEAEWELVHYSTSPTYDELLLKKYTITALTELGRVEDAADATALANELQRKLIVEMGLDPEKMNGDEDGQEKKK